MRDTLDLDNYSVLDDMVVVPRSIDELPTINIPVMTENCKNKGIEPPNLTDEEISMLSRRA